MAEHKANEHASNGGEAAPKTWFHARVGLSLQKKTNI
jgi:hypothetical protein